MITETHGPTIETKKANRPDGPMFWQVAEFAAIGPIVRIRQVKDDGSCSRWETMAVAANPTRYIRATAGRHDIGVPR